jgi:hypothetical protein
MEFNQPLGRTTVRHPINVGDLTLNPASLTVIPDMSDRVAQCPPLAGGRTLEQPTVAIATTQILLAQQQRYYGNGEQPAVQVRHQPYSGPPLRYLVSGRPVRYLACNQLLEGRVDVPLQYSTVRVLGEGRNLSTCQRAKRS